MSKKTKLPTVPMFPGYDAGVPQYEFAFAAVAVPKPGTEAPRPSETASTLYENVVEKYEL